MSATSSLEQATRANRFMVIFGALIITGVAVYFGFMALDGFSLESHEGVARVTDKEYREAGTTYTTQVIGGSTRTIPQTTGEMFILGLDIEGHATEAAVTKDMYSTVRTGDAVQVTYQRRRLTGALQVIDITVASRRR